MGDGGREWECSWRKARKSGQSGRIVGVLGEGVTTWQQQFWVVQVGKHKPPLGPTGADTLTIPSAASSSSSSSNACHARCVAPGCHVRVCRHCHRRYHMLCTNLTPNITRHVQAALVFLYPQMKLPSVMVCRLHEKKPSDTPRSELHLPNTK